MTTVSWRVGKSEKVAIKDDINQLAQQIPAHIVDFNAPRVRGSAPTQASSEFITNREQGDWAERLILQAINQTNREFVAVQYGRSDQFVAGEPGFEQFYESYQDELDAIGKRFTVERNTKNQFKTTIHLNVKKGQEVAYKVTMPQHRSVMKQLPRGRLLFHVTFEGGEAFLNLGTLYNLLRIPNE